MVQSRSEMATGKRLVVGALVVNHRCRPPRVLAARRSTPPAGRWEFPGGKAEAGESARHALVREIQEELGVRVEVEQRLERGPGVRWPISDALEMELWWCLAGGEPQLGDSHDELRWLSADELSGLEWLDADRDALPLVAEGLRCTTWRRR